MEKNEIYLIANRSVRVIKLNRSQNNFGKILNYIFVKKTINNQLKRNFL